MKLLPAVYLAAGRVDMAGGDEWGESVKYLQHWGL